MDSKSKEMLFEAWRKKSANKFADDNAMNIEYNGEIYTAGEVRFLRYINENPDKTSIQLARESGKTRGSVSLIMKKLTEKNLALFQDDPLHRKRKKIIITSLGHEICRIREDYDMDKATEFISALEEKYSSEELDFIMPAICDVISLIN